MAHRKRHVLLSGTVLFASLSAAAFSQTTEKEDFDAYKLRIDAGWYYSNPTGSIQGASDTGSIDLNKDLGFSSYPTFSGKVLRARGCSTGRLLFRGRRSLLD
jgi:hypothetical protein